MNFFTRVTSAIFTKAAVSLSSPIISAVFAGRGGGSYSGPGTLRYPDAVERAYKAIVWVNRCINEIGTAVGSVSWKAYREEKSGTLTPMPNHQLEVLMEKPNPHMSAKEFFSLWAAHLHLGGSSYWETVFVQGKPFNLYPIRPDWMTPQPDPIKYLKGYRLDTGQGKKLDFEPQNILWFRFIDPLNDYAGLSPIQSAARTIDTERSIVSWNQTYFDNAGVPSGVLKVPASILLDEEQKDIESRLREQLTANNRNTPLVLWGGMEWSAMGVTAKDADFLSQKKINKYEICAIMGVPPQIVGANEDPTYSNYAVARLSFWEDKIIPLVDWLKAKVNNAFAPYFNDGVMLLPDLSEVPAMREAFGQKIEQAGKLYTMGVPFNQINQRLRLGFDKLPWGDVWWAPANLMPISDGQALVQPGDGELVDNGNADGE